MSAWLIPSQTCFNHHLTDPLFALHNAAGHGNVKLIRNLIADGYDPNLIEPHVFGTPLHVAIQCNQLPSLLVLLLLGADPEAFEPDSACRNECHLADNSLRMAVRWGRREIVKLLWDIGVKRCSYTDHDMARFRRSRGGRATGGSLLEVAAAHGHIDIARDLLEWGWWEGVERNGALESAAYIWEDELVAMLLARYTFEKPVLKRAVQNLVDGGPKGFRNCYISYNWTVEQSVKEACAMALLLDAGAPVDMDKLLCRVAGRDCEIETLRLLLARGANVSTRGVAGKTPFHFAARRNPGGPGKRACSAEGVKVLLEYGADASLLDDEGVTPVHSLVGENEVELLKLCLEKGNELGGLRDMMDGDGRSFFESGYGEGRRGDGEGFRSAGPNDAQ
ncbi:ankyrin [Byssothecium circinans]|uniref:Ankyrin n=1 Tax=Byssothecium circinans TaxID=147558 RepID=A0A6A5TKD6_9PLEO|nr:ankyrin [Byssothecium circinans]